jgi:hypothetical protein
VPRNVYSQRFLAIKGLSSTSSSVVVPDGFVYVIKQLTAYMNPLLAVSRVFLEDDVSGAALWSAGTSANAPGWFGFYGALAFEPGEGFHWHADVTFPDAVDVYAGGYTLTLP